MTVHTSCARDHSEAGVEAGDIGHDSVVMSMVRKVVSGANPFK